MDESSRDQRVAALRDRLAQLLTSDGASPPEPAGGDDIDQAFAYLDALSAERTRMRADAAYASSRLAELSLVIAGIVSFKPTKRASFSGKNDAFDGLAVCLNVLADQLARSMVSKEYVDNVIESMADLLIVLGTDGLIKTANAAAARLSGYAKEALIGQSINVLFSEIDVADIIAKQNVSYDEIPCRMKAETVVVVSFSASVMLNRRGEFEGIVCVARDLTAARRAEEERLRMREAMQRQSILLQELSTPLIPITDDIVVMPLIGPVDEERAKQMCDVLLHGVVSRQARTAIVDITGVPVVDESTVQGIMKAVHGVRLIGAEFVLTGIRPQVASTLVRLGVDLGSTRTSRSLQSGIIHALRRQTDRT
jgi:rsbT co-antagonist protein RsbR